MEIQMDEMSPSMLSDLKVQLQDDLSNKSKKNEIESSSSSSSSSSSWSSDEMQDMLDELNSRSESSSSSSNDNQISQWKNIENLRNLSLVHNKSFGTNEFVESLRYWCHLNSQLGIQLDASRGPDVKNSDVAYHLL